MARTLASAAKAHLPFAVATIGEFIALYFWLYFFDRQQYVLATFLLWFGFLLERVAVLYWVKVNFGDNIGIAAKDKPLWKKAFGLFLICLSEIAVWVAFVLVYDRFGFWPAFAVVFVGEQIEHSWELSLLSKTSIFKWIFSTDATFITVLEAFGGVGWLYMVREQGMPEIGGALLLLGLTIEHVVQGNAIKRKLKGESQQALTEATNLPDQSAGAEPVS